MARTVTIVMYHYVRDVHRSRFPKIKAQSIERFRQQLDYIQSNYVTITVEELSAALVCKQTQLPPNAALLTFDDGYIDHFLHVFPLLEERQMQGAFFPVAQAVLEHRVLDVNKIHFILASVDHPGRLLDEVLKEVATSHPSCALESREVYCARLGGDHRFDQREVVVLKRLLQRELPESIRREIVQRLFAKHVTADEAGFAAELYMSSDQLACLYRQGMHIGIHGYSHAWLNHLSDSAQDAELDQSLKFLKMLGIPLEQWSICYPYGGYNQRLLDALRKRRCQLGFAVEPRMAELDIDDPLLLPRIDTNDLPA